MSLQSEPLTPDLYDKKIVKDFRMDSEYFWIGKTTFKALDEPHIHNFLQLWYIPDGSCRHNFCGNDFYQQKGDLLIVPPLCVHYIDSSQSNNISLVCCEFTEPFLNSIINDNNNETLFNLTYLKPILARKSLMSLFLSFNKESMTKIEDILSELLFEYQKLTSSSSDTIRMLLIKLLTLIAHEYELTAPQADDALFSKYRSAIQRAMDYIDTNYTKNITLNDISKISLMSVSSFSYVFKQLTGKTFVEYINHMRTNHAKKLLSKTNKSLVDICMECGFYDAAHFNRVFKKITQLTPGLYRKNNQK